MILFTLCSQFPKIRKVSKIRALKLGCLAFCLEKSAPHLFRQAQPKKTARRTILQYKRRLEDQSRVITGVVKGQVLFNFTGFVIWILN